MNQTDRLKVILAGITIIRSREDGRMGDQKPYIVFSSDGCFWKRMEGPFTSKASRNRRMKELLLDDKIIED